MHALVFFFCSAILCSLSIVSFAEATKSLNGFSIDLIHRDSPLSPFYNSSLTPSQLIINAALRSISRFNRNFGLSLNENNESPESIIIPNHGDYLMRIYIGTPPVERFAVADTGSDLIWVQCSPCDNCFPQDTPLFNPKNSSTFMNVSCDSKPCTLLPPKLHACGKSGECIYLYGYGDKSYTSGELGIDSINFGGSTSGTQDVTFPKSIFGCGYNNHDTTMVSDKSTGFVGLGAGPLSLVSQLGDKIGHKFSYCLLPFSSTSNSKFKFGGEAMISGNGVVSTPLIIKSSTLPTFYFLNLEGITVGQKTVQTGQSDGNIVIDSGTTLTLLEQSFYNNLVALVKEALGVEEVQNPPTAFNFCFKYQDGINVPNFVFHFTGASVPMKPYNMFLLLQQDQDYLLCLAVVPTDQNVAIFGNVAQIDFQVEYDLEGKMVSFLPTECTKT